MERHRPDRINLRVIHRYCRMVGKSNHSIERALRMATNIALHYCLDLAEAFDVMEAACDTCVYGMLSERRN